MKVLGISGSLNPDSNTDALIKAIMNATGAEIEFFKLSDIDVGPASPVWNASIQINV